MSSPSASLVFRETFGAAPPVWAKAPGRVNLIGEHTDYHQGFVLPTVLPQHTAVYVRPMANGRIRVLSLAMDREVREYAVGAEAATSRWVDYVQGITWALGRRGTVIAGADLLIDSAVPVGAGLSSSAALEVGLLRALRSAFRLALDDMAVARIAHEAETLFVGAAVGMMDQMVCSMGRPGMAMFLDTRSLTVEHLPIPATIDLVVLDSGIAHRHAGGEYADRRRESFEAAGALEVDYLRDVDPSDMARLERLPPLLRRRARHVISENERVLAAVDALKNAQAERLGVLFNASHVSMRDDYETSVPAIDVLVSLAQSDRDVYGARMTGGGFGGSIVMLTHRGKAQDVATRVLADYQRCGYGAGRILLPPPAVGTTAEEGP